MVTLKDIKDFPKDILKEKKISLYKAFVLKDDDEMNIDVNVDILSIDEPSALIRLISSMSVSDIADTLNTNTVVSFVILTFNKKELVEKDIVDDGSIYFKDGNLSITLKGKEYKVSVQDKLLEKLDYHVDTKTEIKIIDNLVLRDIK